MSDFDVAKLLRLPAEEKLRLIELIWESLSASVFALPLSTNVVVLDPDVAKRFKNSTAVNEALRSLSPADSPTRTRRSARTRRQTSRR